MGIRPTIPDILGVGDLQRQHMWHVSMVRAPAFLKLDSFRMNLQCVSTTVPTRTATSPEVMIRGSRIYDTGIYLPEGTITLTMVETVDAQVREFIKDWQEACNFRKDTFTNISADLRLASWDNYEQDNYEYIIKWAFIEGNTINEMVGDNADFVKPTVTLRYLDFEANKV